MSHHPWRPTSFNRELPKLRKDRCCWGASAILRTLSEIENIGVVIYGIIFKQGIFEVLLDKRGVAMPIISEFYGIKIMMFWNDHFPPHFHAEYGENKILVDYRTPQY